MKENKQFEGRIGKYLSSLADSDVLFAKKFGNPKKSVEECCQYIITSVKESERSAFTDEEIFGMAVHYYEEENPGKIDKSINCTVKMSGEGLSETEKEEVKKQAMEEYKKTCINKFKENLSKVRQRKPVMTEEDPLPSLF